MATKRTPKDQFKAHDRTLPFKGEEAIDAAVLECFEYEYAGKKPDIEIVTVTNEFTSVCPFSGLPDFAEITLTYTPHKKCVELRSLKYYLMSYRDVGIWYEHLVRRMLDDLVRVIQPKKMRLEIKANARGGLASTVSAEYVGKTK
jgi:7-cyano-7-deazaguanine reductase